MRPRRGQHHARKLKPESAPAGGAGVRVPFLAIVGRPNVGKSTLFNRLMGKRISIVEPTAGTTRDRVSAILELPSGERVELCDMGGLGGTDDPLDKDVDRQIKAAFQLANAVLFVTDAREGVQPVDQEIARRLKKLGKPVLLIANKAETTELVALAGELNRLGFGEPLAISAKEGLGRSDLLEAIDKLFAPERDAGDTTAPLSRELRVAIVGRRNAGKSSFVNALFGSERVIVSPLPGTTRDAVDVRCLVDGEPIVLIDTAGLRKRGKADDAIELISHGRAREAIRRSDVAILVLDALRDVAEVDKKIAELVLSENKALVFAANKWDLVKDLMTVEKFTDYIRKKMPSAHFAPVAAISCTKKRNIKAPVHLARELYQQSLIRVTTGELNRVVHEAFARRRPRKKRHVDAKIYFATQIRTNPVTLVIFVNKPALFDADYERYLSNELRASLPWPEVPIKLVIRERRGLIERGLTRAQRDERREARASKLEAWLEDESRASPEEVAAELDRDDVRAALAAELDAEEAAARAKLPSFVERLGEHDELDAGEDDDLALDEDEAAGEGEPEFDEKKRPPPKNQDGLLYGQDADMIRRRRDRFRARRDTRKKKGPS